MESLPAKPLKSAAVRRSQRLLLTVRVLVSGKQVSGLAFSEDARNQERMIQLAGGNPDRVIPGHDASQFQKYPT